MEPGFCPLDEELGLLPGPWSPRLQEDLARLGARLPLAQAAAEFTAFTHVPVSDTTVRRHTHTAGAASVAVQAAAVEHLEQAAHQARPAEMLATEPPASAAVVQMSVDGAFVPLVAGEWAEVKTLAVGEVVAYPDPDDPQQLVARTTQLSYFSRVADAETFGPMATAELHERGVDRAATVVAINDGAEWIQGFVDLHRPDAVRTLAFPHAVEYLSAAAHAVWGPEAPAASAWLALQRHELKHGSAHAVLGALARLPVERAADPPTAAQQRATSVQYLTKRLDQVPYAAFRAHGYPIGSGCVASANKLVVQARLKGSGRHWARPHVDPVLALRNALRSGRWTSAWAALSAERRRQVQQERRQRQHRHSTRAAATPQRPLAPVLPTSPPPSLTRPKLVIDGRPTSRHPWRRPLLAGGHRFATAHPKL